MITLLDNDQKATLSATPGGIYIFHDNFNSFGDCPNNFYFFMDAGVQNAAVMTFNAKNKNIP